MLAPPLWSLLGPHAQGFLAGQASPEKGHCGLRQFDGHLFLLDEHPPSYDIRHFL
jgi:hypothetical protein